MMNVQTMPAMDVDAFFRWAESRTERYELVDGVPHMLPWVKLNHSRIVTNLMIEIARTLDRSRFDLVAGDFGVRVSDNGVRFPDLMVIAAGSDGRSRETTRPLLIAEVLSDTTMHTDFGAKLWEYQGLESLFAYGVVGQDQQKVWLWLRGDNGSWPDEPEQLSGNDAVLTIAGLGLAIPVAAIHAGVN